MWLRTSWDKVFAKGQVFYDEKDDKCSNTIISSFVFNTLT